jgi:hypothetical protein
VSSLPTYKDELTTRANNLAKIYKDFNDIFKNNDSGKAKDTADSLSAFIDGLKNADSETLKTLGNSEFFTNLSEGLK